MKPLTRWLPLLVIGVMVVFSVARYRLLPTELPVHFNIDGSVNTLPRDQAIWVMPGLTALVWLIMGITPYIDRRRELYRRYHGYYTLSRNTAIFLLLGIHVVTLTYFDDPSMIARLAIIGVLLTFIVIGNETPRVPAEMLNWTSLRWLAIRLKPSRRTSRFAGRALVLVGLTCLPAALMLPMATLTLVMMVTLTLALIGIGIFAYLDTQQASA